MGKEDSHNLRSNYWFSSTQSNVLHMHMNALDIRLIIPKDVREGRRLHVAHMAVINSAISAQKSSTMALSLRRANTRTSFSGSESKARTPAGGGGGGRGGKGRIDRTIK